MSTSYATESTESIDTNTILYLKSSSGNAQWQTINCESGVKSVEVTPDIDEIYCFTKNWNSSDTIYLLQEYSQMKIYRSIVTSGVTTLISTLDSKYNGVTGSKYFCSSSNYLYIFAWDNIAFKYKVVKILISTGSEISTINPNSSYVYLASDGSNLYILVRQIDGLTYKIQKYNSSDTLLVTSDTIPYYDVPNDFRVDSSGNPYIGYLNLIQKYDSSFVLDWEREITEGPEWELNLNRLSIL